MPQIGWFEILVVVVLAILIIGPKDFPVVVRKIGNWTGSIKKYFSEIQKDINEVKDSYEDDLLIDKYKKDKLSNKEKNE
jgi:sec-independent protein translocase protein TatB